MMILGVPDSTVLACFCCHGIGTRALQSTRSVVFIILALVKLTQHPSYDPIFFVETLCIVALLINRLGLSTRLTIYSQDLVMYCRFADLNVRIGWPYLCLSAKGRVSPPLFPLYLHRDHLSVEATNCRDYSKFVLFLELPRPGSAVSRISTLFLRFFYLTFINS
jgi:hypothetical protein